MNDKLKELIQPYWVEEQQGVYIPLIDKVLLKNNVPEMPYGDYMEYAKSNGVQIATKDELLQMYLQKDEINKILREHNGDMLDTWFGSSSEYGLYYEWFVNFGSGYCYYATKLNYSASRVVVDLKPKKTNNMKQYQAAGISGIFREDERDTGPRPSVHRIAPALEDCSEEGRGKRREQLVGHDLGWY